MSTILSQYMYYVRVCVSVGEKLPLGRALTRMKGGAGMCAQTDEMRPFVSSQHFIYRKRKQDGGQCRQLTVTNSATKRLERDLFRKTIDNKSESASGKKQTPKHKSTEHCD
ncbi:MAG: hypothetical protein GY820_34615 [Gammaproteobacteria bacterium]|nr:hypothetical protein [Gammaproteobacteria bacterium]